jgi:hypothetical protein
MCGGNEQENGVQGELSRITLRDYHDGVRRRQWLFLGVSIFLVVDALVFFAALGWASWMVGARGADWHVYASALLPGALGAVLAVMSLKAVYRMPQSEGLQSEDLAPGYETWKGTATDLSGD